MSGSKKESPKQPTFTGVPDAFYDSDFSLGISKKMRVPDKIRLAGDQAVNMLNDPAILAVRNDADTKLMMNVPERICVAGGETHLSGRGQLPEQKLENSLLGKPQDKDELVQLTTPPRTLRVADTQPVFETAIQKLDKALHSANNLSTRTPRMNDSRLMDSIMDLEESDLISVTTRVELRRTLTILGQRINALETESKWRNKRDLLLYTFGFLYVLFRGVTWFTSRNRINYF